MQKVYTVATAVSMAYRVGARHRHLVGWVGLAAPQYRRLIGILYAMVTSIAVSTPLVLRLLVALDPPLIPEAYSYCVRHGYDR
jgi:hypothetical protein